MNKLCQAICGNDANEVKLLVSLGIDLNTPDDEGRLPLCVAIDTGHVDIVTMLVKAGADVFLRRNSFRSPIDEAVSRVASLGDTAALQALISSVEAIDTPDQQGASPLCRACIISPDAVGMLLAYGANANWQDANADTPLCYACMLDSLTYDTSQSIRTVSLLLAHGADVDLTLKHRDRLMQYLDRAIDQPAAQRVRQVLEDRPGRS